MCFIWYYYQPDQRQCTCNENWCNKLKMKIVPYAKGKTHDNKTTNTPELVAQPPNNQSLGRTHEFCGCVSRNTKMTSIHGNVFHVTYPFWGEPIDTGEFPYRGSLMRSCNAQSLATNSPGPGPRPLTCGVSSECLDTRSYETTSRDQRGKIQMFFSSTSACTATKSPIANHRSSIVAQLYFASVTQMFMMPLFVKVESGSSKLLRTVSQSGPNGCKERPRPQKMLMRIKIERVF